jgi:hypothetical protein
MRLNQDISTFIQTGLKEIDPGSEVYLFGSRVNDGAKGGDIDILWLTKDKIPQSKIRKFKIKFYQSFGWQKIDIVNFTFDTEDVFKDIAMQEAIRIQ